MIDESAAVLPLWMLFSAIFGFMVGDAFGDATRHRKCLEEANEELRERLNKAAADTKPIERALKEQRSVINDIHSRLLAVSKPIGFDITRTRRLPSMFLSQLPVDLASRSLMY